MGFPKLTQALMDKATGIKQEVIIRTITANSYKIVDRKAALLEKCVFVIAIIASGIAAAQIIGLSVSSYLTLITREIHQYMKAFGLDDESTENLAKILCKNGTDLEQIIFGTSNVSQGNNITGVNSIIMETLDPTTAAGVVRVCAQVGPIFGQMFSSRTSFLTVKSALEQVLNKIKLLAYRRADLLRTLTE
jgi:hypothetical protein